MTENLKLAITIVILFDMY